LKDKKHSLVSKICHSGKQQIFLEDCTFAKNKSPLSEANFIQWSKSMGIDDFAAIDTQTVKRNLRAAQLELRKVEKAASVRSTHRGRTHGR
jgi:hypothetical protein